MMKTAGYGFTILTALTVVCVSFVCYAFVDDTDLVHTRGIHATGEEILSDMQGVVDHWEGGLRTTGGALVPSKSYWYLIDFIWTGKEWKYASLEDVPGDITIRSVDGSGRETLKRHEVDHAEETLGVFLAMDGNNVKECKKLREKANEYAACIRSGFISRDDAVVALHSTIMKSLEYPMAAITLTKKEWDYIMAPILKAALPRMGYVQSFPRDIVYAPKELLGLGIMHPWFNQELTHIETCLQEGTAETIAGDLLRASTEQLRLELGLSTQIGTVPTETKKALSLATDCWLKTVHEFATSHGMRIEDTSPALDSYRRQDRFLIEEFISNGYQGRDLKMLNECRMFLKTVCLSEITSADGERIEQWAWEGTKRTHGLNKYKWPRSQPHLSRGHWNLWKQALTRCFLTPAGTEKQLRSKVGKIKATLSNDWKWWYSESEERVYHKEGAKWAVYSRVPTRVRRLRSLKFLKQFRFEDTLPNDAKPASIARCANNRLSVTGVGEFDEEIPRAERPTNLDMALAQRPLNDQWAVSVIDHSDQGISVARAIIQGTAKAISDGSFKDEMGTSATVLYGADEKRIISTNDVPGNREDQSAYRSELAGIEGALAIIESLCKVHDIQDGAITIGLDGQQALLEAGGDWPLSPTQAAYDMLFDIRSKIRRLPITVHWKWIKGHQDDDANTELDEWAKANVMVDNLAKSYWNHLCSVEHEPQSQRFGDEGWALHINNKKVSKFDKNRIYQSLYNEKVIEYWAKKAQRHREAMRSVDWAICGTAFKKLPIPKQRRVTKHCSGHMACRRMMKLWKFQDHEECPRCPEQRETPLHVL
jgi:ribonuclease HI